MRRVRHEQLGPLQQSIEAIEGLLFEHRFDDGTTVLDRFAARHPGLDVAERELLDAWSDSVHGIFEIIVADGDVLQMTNLFDDLPYTSVASGGAQSIADVVPGSYLITRILPVAGVWTLSGTQVAFTADARDGLAAVVAERALEHPDLVLRNPDYRRSAERIAAALHESFLDCFGSDLLVVRGVEVESRYREFLTFHTMRSTSEAAALDRVTDMAAQHEAQAGFADVDTVALHSHPLGGVSFYANYAEVAAAFDQPTLAADHRQRALVHGYLDDETIPPWIITRLAEQCPDADALFAGVLARPDFRWDRDGESLLRERKSSYIDAAIAPGATVLPRIALEKYSGISGASSSDDC